MDELSVGNDALPADLQVDLPFELVLTILELLALQFPRKALQLVLVSRAVQRCIDPILYESVYLHHEHSVSLFARTVTGHCTNKPPLFFQNTVKNICFDVFDDLDDADDLRDANDFRNAHCQDIISVCSNIDNLALYDSVIPGFKYEGLKYENLPLRRLSTEYQSLLDHLAHPFPNLTHLEVYDAPWELAGLSSLPLTHLSLTTLSTPDAEAITLLSERLGPNLKVCVVYSSAVLDSLDKSGWLGNCEHDIRIVFCVYRQPPDDMPDALKEHFILFEWSPFSGKSDSMWELAEKAVEKRRERLRQREAGR